MLSDLRKGSLTQTLKHEGGTLFSGPQRHVSNKLNNARLGLRDVPGWRRQPDLLVRGLLVDHVGP